MMKLKFAIVLLIINYGASSPPDSDSSSEYGYTDSSSEQIDNRTDLQVSEDTGNIVREFPSSWTYYLDGDNSKSYGSLPINRIGSPYYYVVNGDDASATTATGIGNYGYSQLSQDPQQLMNTLLDWNYEMTPDQQDYYCGDMPDMEMLCQNFSKSNFFYDMNPNCMGLVRDVGRVLGDMPTASSTLQMALCMRDSEHLNPQAWIRALVMNMIQKPSMSGLKMPPMVEVMPSMFLKYEQVEEAKHQSTYRPERRKCVPVNGRVGEDNGVENLLWYWREDVMLNSFHWYWHLTYPFMGTTPRGDRRGELFYYVHHSLVARYHAERLSMGLGEVQELELYQGTRIEEPYNSHLTDMNSGNFWTPRMPNVIIRDVNVVPATGDPQMVDIDERLVRLRRILQAIKAGKVVAANSQKIPLRNFDGIDILGDVIEASIWTVNQDLYGYPGVHNGGHILIGLVEDPQGELGLPPGVMADPGTAMRDPAFYRYHKNVDNWFTKYKDSLPPYQPEEGDLPLVFEGVKIVSLAVRPKKGARSQNSLNKLRTYFTTRTYDLSRGLDFNRTFTSGPIQACVKHLDYEKFNYEIVIKRGVHSTARATIRVFMAPRYNLNGVRYSLEEQRLHYFQLDRFPVYLSPGLNKIIRKSTESTLTIPFPQSYQQLQSSQQMTTYCGCGWPDNLLIPRGTINGLDFDLFTMVTNGDDDAVPVPVSKSSPGQSCRPAPIFCGIAGENYPDAKPMGYPFDRRPYYIGSSGWWSGHGSRSVSTIEEYVENVPNSAVVTVRIYHKSLDNIQIYPVKSPPHIKRKEPVYLDCSGSYNLMCLLYSVFKKKR